MAKIYAESSDTLEEVFGETSEEKNEEFNKVESLTSGAKRRDTQDRLNKFFCTRHIFAHRNRDFLRHQREQLCKLLLTRFVKAQPSDSKLSDLDHCVTVKNVETERVTRTDLWSAKRCHLAKSLLENLFTNLHHVEKDETIVTTIVLGCSDHGELSKKYPGAVICSVGSVIDGDTRRREQTKSLLDPYQDIFRSYLLNSRERIGQGDESALLSRVHLASACNIVFQLIGSPLSRVCVITGKAEALKDSMSVLYNYARLAKLVKKYQECYPPLPDVSEADFSLLIRDNNNLEWDLISCLLHYGDVVRSSVQNWQRGKFSLENIPRFLVELSRTVSRYYRHTQILVQPQPHLLPIIQARMCLVLALIKIYDDLFTMLGIQPIYNV